MRPYLLMAALYLALAALAALSSALEGLGLLQFFNGLRWLRVHLITLGGLTQLAFGLLPAMTARRTGIVPPRTRWDIWVALNLGLLILLTGIPLMNSILIITGGMLVFAATSLLVHELWRIWRAQPVRSPSLTRHKPDTRPFYLAAVVYLLVGILAGTGLWFGWGTALGMDAPIEVHVHANLWGFTALLLAGLVTQIYPELTGTSAAWPKRLPVIFWGMTLGALGLVSGPWLGSNALTLTGLIIHSLASLALLASWSWPLLRKQARRSPGLLHILLAYIWFILPVVVAPLIVFRMGETAREISGSGGPILIYGWILPVLYALLPYFVRRWMHPGKDVRSGGTWFSLLAVQAGSLLFWTSLFLPTASAALRPAAYSFWLVSLVAVLYDLFRSLRLVQGQETTGLEPVAPAVHPDTDRHVLEEDINR